MDSVFQTLIYSGVHVEAFESLEQENVPVMTLAALSWGTEQRMWR